MEIGRSSGPGQRSCAQAEWKENGSIDRFLLDPGVQLERGRGFVKDPGDVPVDDIRDFVDRSIKKETALAPPRSVPSLRNGAVCVSPSSGRPHHVGRTMTTRAPSGPATDPTWTLSSRA
jgi:hypothetical protein